MRTKRRTDEMQMGGSGRILEANMHTTSKRHVCNRRVFLSKAGQFLCQRF